MAATPPAGAATKTWRFHMDRTRDVAFGASRAFVWDAARANLTGGKTALVQSSSIRPRNGGPGAWGRSTEYVKFAVEDFSRRWFPYPWPDIVNLGGPVQAMEYPAMLFDSAADKGRTLFYFSVHEAGHTYFPMLVGTDERRHMWMDEGLNTFIDVYESDAFNHAEYGPKRDGEYAPGPQPPGDQIAAILADPAAPPIMTRADVIPGRYGHPISYFKAAYGLTLLREDILGPDRFDPAFRKFIAEWAYKHPKPADFFRAMESESGRGSRLVHGAAGISRPGATIWPCRASPMSAMTPPRARASPSPTAASWSCRRGCGSPSRTGPRPTWRSRPRPGSRPAPTPSPSTLAKRSPASSSTPTTACRNGTGRMGAGRRNEQRDGRLQRRLCLARPIDSKITAARLGARRSAGRVLRPSGCYIKCGVSRSLLSARYKRTPGVMKGGPSWSDHFPPVPISTSCAARHGPTAAPPRHAGGVGGPLMLAKAQTALARDYDFASWPKLKAEVDAQQGARLAATWPTPAPWPRRWFALARLNDSCPLLRSMGIGKTRLEAARE